MCRWGTDVVMPLEIPADCSHSGKAYIKNVGVDACLAPIIKALNDSGIKTVSSCCGHGKALGCIALADKRWLLIYPSRAAAERALDAFDANPCRCDATCRDRHDCRHLAAADCPCEQFPCVHTTRPHKRL